MYKICRAVQWSMPVMLLLAVILRVPVWADEVISTVFIAFLAKRVADAIRDREICHANMAKYIQAGGLSAPAERRKIER